MTTKKSTKRPSSRREYIDYFPDLTMRMAQKDDKYYEYSKPVPVVLSASLPMSEDNKASLRYLVASNAEMGKLYDRTGRRLLRSDDLDAFPRVYEVSVPKTVYRRALEKAKKITDKRLESYKKEGRDYRFEDIMYEDLHSVVGDLARRTRMRKRRSGRTSLRR